MEATYTPANSNGIKLSEGRRMALLSFEMKKKLWRAAEERNRLEEEAHLRELGWTAEDIRRERFASAIRQKEDMGLGKRKRTVKYSYLLES